jgi:hypothetical protein
MLRGGLPAVWRQVWCSTPFYDICGYSAAECIGRNCRFLQVCGIPARAGARVRPGPVESIAVERE